MKKLASKQFLVTALIVTFMFVQNWPANALTAFCGDSDGFGVGVTSGNLSSIADNNQGPGEAPFTDLPLTNVFFPEGPFMSTGSFSAYVIPVGEAINSAILTLRTAAFTIAVSWVWRRAKCFSSNSILKLGTQDVLPERWGYGRKAVPAVSVVSWESFQINSPGKWEVQAMTWVIASVSYSSPER
jgi:hypothetical protein